MIHINEKFIKEVKKELRNKRNSGVGAYIRIDIENKKILVSFDRYNDKVKYSNNDDRKQHIIMEDALEIDNEYSIKTIHLHNIDYNDVLLDVLLSNSIYIETYKYNSEQYKLANGNEIYMSTIVVKNKRKQAVYSTMCNEMCNMIIY